MVECPQCGSRFAKAVGMGGHMRHCDVTHEQIFWTKVRKGRGCWEWMAGKMKCGYGSVNIKHKRYIASRLSWQYTNGPIPKGLWVLHKCDNRACVRPSHLYLGDNKANMADKKARGRFGTRYQPVETLLYPKLSKRGKMGKSSNAT